MELCAGTHTARPARSAFPHRERGAIAAGVRRIEAVAGHAVGEWAQAEAARQEETFQALARKKSGARGLARV